MPFGFGLSYSSFSYTIALAPSGAVSLEPIRRLLSDASVDTRRMFPRLEDARGMALAQYVVNVTNTGNMDADDVVLGFIKPPGAGTEGIPLQTLFGFERVHVKAGCSVLVTIYPSMTDFTRVMLSGQRAPLGGEYVVQFGLAETHLYGQGFVNHKITAM